MFIGHFSVGFAAKRFAPRTSMGALLAAPLFLDLLWPVFLLLGWEQVRIDPGNTRYTPLDLYHYPWSHSLLMAVVWATGFALILLRGHALRAGSGRHLDWRGQSLGARLGQPSARHAAVSGRTEIRAGFVELDCRDDGDGVGMMAVGVWLYVRTTRASDRIGRYALVSYVGLLLVLYIGDRFSGPPPSVGAIAWTGITASVVFLPWAWWWFDRHREVVPVESR
jgi:hypothetical protein